MGNGKQRKRKPPVKVVYATPVLDKPKPDEWKQARERISIVILGVFIVGLFASFVERFLG